MCRSAAKAASCSCLAIHDPVCEVATQVTVSDRVCDVVDDQAIYLDVPSPRPTPHVLLLSFSFEEAHHGHQVPTLMRCTAIAHRVSAGRLSVIPVRVAVHQAPSGVAVKFLTLKVEMLNLKVTDWFGVGEPLIKVDLSDLPLRANPFTCAPCTVGDVRKRL